MTSPRPAVIRLVALGLLSGSGGLSGSVLGADIGIIDLNIYDVGALGPGDQAQFLVGYAG